MSSKLLETWHASHSGDLRPRGEVGDGGDAADLGRAGDGAEEPSSDGPEGMEVVSGSKARIETRGTSKISKFNKTIAVE